MDIVERLRKVNPSMEYFAKCRDAANEIERLRAELDRRDRLHKEDFDNLSGYVREFSKLEAENFTLRGALKECGAKERAAIIALAKEAGLTMKNEDPFDLEVQWICDVRARAMALVGDGKP